jgi:hypothetical protein
VVFGEDVKGLPLMKANGREAAIGGAIIYA